MKDHNHILRSWRSYFEDLHGDKAERKFMLDGNIRDTEGRLGKWFRSMDERDVGAIASNFGALASWYGGEATVQILNGDEKEWFAMQRALLLRWYESRIARAQWPMGVNNVLALSVEALTFAHALAVGVEDVAKWFCEDLMHLSRPQSQVIWENDRVENFVVWLCAQWSGDSSYYSGKSLGVYQRICDAWQAGGDAMKEAIVRVCDWRMDHTMEKDPNDEKISWGYDYPPYAMFPAELLAAEQIRRKQGLAVVRPDHPLLQTPLADPPYPLRMPHDPLVERAVAAIRKNYPSL